MLKDALARLSRHTVVYAVAGQASRLLSFALIPFYTNHLSPVDYGINEMLSLMLSVLAYLAGINMAGAMARFYFERVEPHYRHSVVSTALLTVTAASLVVAGLLALGAAPIGRLLGDGFPGMTRLVLVTLAILALQTVREMFFQYLRTEERSTAFAAISLFKLAVELGLQIWFVAWLGWGVFGLFAAVLAGETLTVVVMSGLVLPVTGLRFSPELFRGMALFVLPLIPTGLLQFCLHSGDRYILKALTGNAEVGIYGLAYKFGYIPNYLLLTPFLMIWYPFVFSLGDDGRRREMMERFTPYFMFALTACCLGTALFARELVVLMSGQPEYHAAWPAIAPVCAGYWCWGCFQIVQTGFYIRQRTGRMPLLTAIAVAANVALNLLLIPRLGFMGAAWATLVTFALLLFLTVRAVRPVFDVPWPWRRILVPALSAGALCVAATLPDLEPGAVSIGIKLAGALGWLAWMWAGGFLDHDERGALIAALRGFARRK